MTSSIRASVILDDARAAFIDVHRQAQKLTGPFELPEPDHELRERIRQIAEHEANVVHQRA